MAGWIAVAIDKDGNQYTVDHPTRSLKKVKKQYENGEMMSEDGKILALVDTFSKKDYHICPYCKGIAGSSEQDLLCGECRELFGHAFYSEL